VHPFWLSHKKMSLVEALHPRAVMAGVGAPSEAPWGTCQRGRGEGKKGRDWGAVGGAPWGGGGLQEGGAPWGLSPAAPLSVRSSAFCT
jgi:hypothetical protein